MLKRFSIKHVRNGTLPERAINELMRISNCKCIWCGRKVQIYEFKSQPTKGQIYPKDMATVDHLIPRPYRRSGEISPKVLSCAECNKNRGVMYNEYFRK